MAEIRGEKPLFLGRSTKFWTIASVGAAFAFAGVLGCGLLMGVGAFSIMRFFATEGAIPAVAAATTADRADTGALEATETDVDTAEATDAEAAAPAVAQADAGQEKPVLPPRIGNPASDFTLSDLEGNTVSLSDFAGQPVIINFWATWCGPCEAEMPAINEAYLNYQAEGLVVLAVDIAEHPDTVKSFVNYYELDFTILLDRDAEVAKQYNARALPTTYFIDSSGIIVHAYFGQMREKDLAVGLKKILP